MRARSIIARSAAVSVLLALLVAAPAAAATGHGPPLMFADFLGIGHLAGSVFGGIGHAVLGAFTWTFELASKFLLTTIGAIVKLLIPRSWAQEGVQIMQWIVQIPNYAGTITNPTGGHVYGFAGINALRDLFTWIGVGLLPLTLVYATSRAIVGHGDHVAIPLVRVLGFAALLISYPYWWQQGAAVINQITHMVLSLSPVVTGLHKLMLYAVDGVALGGWQLIDLALMAAIAGELLALIFLKVAIILLGALLYATGPLTIGLIPTDAGHALARAWASAVGTLLMLPVVWAAVFAVGALLINDAGTAGPLIAGSSTIGTLLGGVLLAVAGLAALWVCLRAAREAANLLRIQLGGLLALAHGHKGSSTATGSGTGAGGSNAARSIRGFGGRVAEARSAAIGALGASSPAGARLARAGGLAGGVGRRGALGTAAAAAGAGLGAGAPAAAALIGRSRAGAVAVQMARAGTASWQNTAKPSHNSNGLPSNPTGAPAALAGAGAASTPAAKPGGTGPSPPPAGASSSVRGPAASPAVQSTPPRAGSSPTPVVTPSGTRPANSSPNGSPASAPRSPASAPKVSGGTTPRGPRPPKTTRKKP